MAKHIPYPKISPKPFQLMLGIEAYIQSCGLDAGLVHLVKLRASQINGCAYCIDMHWKDARAAGESEHRLYGLNAFRECPWYDARERAALEWTEAITHISNGPPSEALRAELANHFSEKEIVDLTWVVAAINAWNRVAITFHSEPGHYQPPRSAQ